MSAAELRRRLPGEPKQYSIWVIPHDTTPEARELDQLFDKLTDAYQVSEILGSFARFLAERGEVDLSAIVANAGKKCVEGGN